LIGYSTSSGPTTKTTVSATVTIMSNFEYNNLTDFVSKVRRKHFYCPYDNCGCGRSNFSTEYSNYPDNDMYIMIHCRFCNRLWYLCKACVKKKIFPILSPQGIETHYWNCHARRNKVRAIKSIQPISRCDTVIRNENTNNESADELAMILGNDLDTNNAITNDPKISEVESIDNLDTDSVTGDYMVNDDFYYSDTTNSLINTKYHIEKDNNGSGNWKEISFAHFQKKYSNEIRLQDIPVYLMNTKSSTYFLYEIETQCGLSHLVSQAHNHTDALVPLLSNEEVKLQMIIADFIRMLKQTQRERFANVLSSIISLIIKNQNSHKTVVCQLPNDIQDIRKFFIDSKYSIPKNVPVPECTMMDHHSYVTIKECISDYLAHGLHSIMKLDDWPIANEDINYKVNGTMFQSKCCNEIIQKAYQRKQNHVTNPNIPVLCFFLTFWSDDFEPNSSTKANRQSVWIKTMTIHVLTTDFKHKKTTYPISLAKKGMDHSVIDEVFIKKWKNYKLECLLLCIVHVIIHRFMFMLIYIQFYVINLKDEHPYI